MEKSNILSSIIKQCLIISLYFFLNISLTLIFYKDITTSNLCGILSCLITLLVFLIIFRKKIIPDFYDFRKNGIKYLKDNFKYYIIGLLIMLISNFILSFFLSTPTNQVSVQKSLFLLPIYSLLNIIIFAPIIEEAMFRIILKDTFKHPIIYIVISGHIFGLLHVIFNLNNNIGEILYVIPYGSLGSMLALMYYKTDNIWTNICYHSFHNLLCVLIIFSSL